jgi:hypothetical protein
MFEVSFISLCCKSSGQDNTLQRRSVLESLGLGLISAGAEFPRRRYNSPQIFSIVLNSLDFQFLEEIANFLKYGLQKAEGE